MQYTSNYNLMLPEGTDTVNLLTQMNPNTSDIDAAMYANKQASVGRATELTSGTVHAITRSNPDSPVFAFTATSNWTAGDTMTVDGTACTVYLSDGTTPATGAYIINTEVFAILNGTRITLIGSGASLQSVAAEDVTYDNTTSGLAATDVQAAIDEIVTGAPYEVVATAAANQSVSSQLAILETAFNLLTEDEKLRTAILDVTVADAIEGIYHIDRIPQKLFSSLAGGITSFNIDALRLGTQTRYICVITGGTFTISDISSSVNSNKLVLVKYK